MKPPLRTIISALSNTENHASALNNWLAVTTLLKKRKKELNSKMKTTVIKMLHSGMPVSHAVKQTAATYKPDNSNFKKKYCRTSTGCPLAKRWFIMVDKPASAKNNNTKQRLKTAK
jgi:hypothetical protein